MLLEKKAEHSATKSFEDRIKKESLGEAYASKIREGNEDL